MRRWCVLTICALVLPGCGGGASVSESQCFAGDWRTLGYRDGVRGYRSTQILEHQDACVKHGVVPDRDGYMLGWDEGVREYCLANNAFSLGEHGYGHNNVCPADLRGDFLDAYREGRSLYLARAEVHNLERKISRKHQRLEQVKAEIVSTAAAQLRPELTPTRRVELIAQTHRLVEEKTALQREIPSLEAELAVKENKLATLNRTLASVSYSR